MVHAVRSWYSTYEPNARAPGRSGHGVLAAVTVELVLQVVTRDGLAQLVIVQLST